MLKYQEKIHSLLSAFEDPTQVKVKAQFFEGVLANDISTIEIIVQAVKQQLQNTECSSSTQLKVIEFLKECVDSWNNFLVKRMKQELLPLLWNILSKTKGDEPKDSESQEDQDLLRLLLECIFIWSKWFTADNELEEMLQKLQAEGLKLPETLKYFQPLDILYSDVQTLKERHLIHVEEYIFPDNKLFFEQFLCQKQVEYEKGVVANKVLGFPTVIHLQNRTENLHSNKGDDKLKMSWDNSEVKDMPFRLLCKRGGENRTYSIYFPTLQAAIKIQDYIHFVKAKTQLPRLSQLVRKLVGRFHSSVASEVCKKREAY